MERRSRLAGLLFFIVLVAAVQIAEHLYRWYVHRDERAQLTVLREELIDVGAEMIEAQLDVEHFRAEIQTLDAEGDRRRNEAYSRRWARTHMYAYVARPGNEEYRMHVLQRNRHLDHLNDAVARRNSAAARYYLLADSIRSVAERARDPYFAIPLPAEAATARGITPAEPPRGAARSHPATGSTARAPQPEVRQAHH